MSKKWTHDRSASHWPLCGMNRNLLQLRADGVSRNPQLIVSLQVHPEFRLRAKKLAEPQRGIRRDGPLASNNLTDPTRRYAEQSGQLSLCQPFTGVYFICQDLSRVDWGTRHVLHLSGNQRSL